MSNFSTRSTWGRLRPLFAYKGINGERVALAGFKGKVVLLSKVLVSGSW
jgi:hypothetical protein